MMWIYTCECVYIFVCVCIYCSVNPNRESVKAAKEKKAKKEKTAF